MLLSDRLGGPRLISRQTWLISAAFGSMVLIADVSRLGVGDFGGLLGVLPVSLGLTVAGQFLMGRTFVRTRDVAPVGLGPAMLVLFVTSVLYFGPLVVYAEWAGLDAFSYTFAQAPVQVLLGVACHCVVIVILDSRDSAIAGTRIRLVRQAQIDGITTKHDEFERQIERQIVAEISAELAAGRARLDVLNSGSVVASNEQAEELSRVLRSIAADQVRPTSRRLQALRNDEALKPGLRSLLKATVSTQPLRTLDMSVIIMVALLPAEIRAFGVVRGIVFLSLGVAIFASICALSNVVLRRFTKWRKSILLLTFGLLQVNTYVANAIRNTWQAGYISNAYFVFEIVAMAFIMLVCSAFPVWRRRYQSSTSLWRDSIDGESRETFMRSASVARIANEAAKVLHGSVQSRLYACAMSIDAARSSGDLSSVSRSLDEALALLDEPLFSEVTFDGIEAEVRRKVALWHGLVDVVLRLSLEGPDECGPTAQSVGLVVEEAIANAVRHGSASSIEIQISRVERGISIFVVDDGLKEWEGDLAEMPEKWGLGLSSVNAICAGRWSMIRAGGSTQIEAVIPGDRPIVG